MKVLLSILIIGLLLFSACGTLNSERQEIISFTQEALEIETKRNELNSYIGSFWEGSSFQKWPASQYLLPGVPQGIFRNDTPKTDLAGMLALREATLLLECPQSMQLIKDALVHIYNSEINLAELEFQHGEEYSPLVPFLGKRFVLPEVNQYNIELWQAKYKSWQMPGVSLFMNHPWVKLQLLRRDIYTRWVEILQEHDIDPLEEGFTSLIK